MPPPAYGAAADRHTFYLLLGHGPQVPTGHFVREWPNNDARPLVPSCKAKLASRRTTNPLCYASCVAVHMWRAMLRLTRHPAAPGHTRTKERITVRYDSSICRRERTSLPRYVPTCRLARQVHPAKPDVRDDRHAHARVQTLRAGR